MGRSPCCSKEGLKKGAWTAMEDKILTAYIKAHGDGSWRNLPKRAGLKRCGKSCRLRWLNYLRPDIKRGNISHDEEELIIRLHNLLGNRWSLIAGRLPGRTDNEIKNYWNTTLGKKAKAQSSSPTSPESPPTKSKPKKLMTQTTNSSKPAETKNQVIRTKATRFSSRVQVTPPAQPQPIQGIDIDHLTPQLQDFRSSSLGNQQEMDTVNGNQSQQRTEVVDALCSHWPGFSNFASVDVQLQASNGESEEKNGIDNNPCMDPMEPLSFDEEMLLKDWTTNPCLDDNATMDLESLEFLLDPNQWP